MKQFQLACSNGLGFNPFTDETSIARSAGLNPVCSLLGEITNHPTFAKFILNPLHSVFSGLRYDSAVASNQVARGNFFGDDDGIPRALDARLMKQMSIAEQQPITSKDIKSQICEILSVLRIPIVNKFVDHMAMVLESTNASASEIHEDPLNNMELKIPDVIYDEKARRIRDPLHNLIEFEDDKFYFLLWKIIQTKPFQRLRRIKQLGFSEFVYPGATHTRLQHSLGVYHNARRLIAKFRKKLGKDFNQERAEVAIIAALVHDVGHGPYSHAFESVGRELEFKFAKHERVSKEIILNSEIGTYLNDHRKGLAKLVADMVVAETPLDIYATIVSSQFDADRLDYLERDQLMTGSQNSQIDLIWLISNIEIRKVPVEIEPGVIEEVETIVFSSKAKLALQTYILGLFNLYNSVYFHPVTRAAEQVFKHLLLRIHNLIQRGDMDKIALHSNHPIICFFQNPNHIESVMPLNDNVISAALEDLINSEDKFLANLAIMLFERRLPKAFDVREQVKEYFQGDEFKGLTKKKRNELIDDSVDQYREQLQNYIKKSNLEEQVWYDSGSRTAYKPINKETGKLNTIQVLENGKVFGIEELSVAVEVAEEYKFERVYLPFVNPEISNFLNSQITTCCKEVSQHGM